jgi:cyclic beta-1,2-glucan synthetase
MKANSLRVVLAFYPAGDNCSDIFAALKQERLGRIAGYRTGGASLPAHHFAAEYADLRLDGECLIAIQSTPENVPAIVQAMLHQGSPAVFALHPRSPAGFQPDGVPPDEAARSSQVSLAELLRDIDERFEAACNELAEAARLDHTLTAAAEWVLDNAYLVRTHISEIRAHLPRGRRAMGRDRSAALSEIARQLIADRDCAVNADSISSALQLSQPLTMAELWLFPLILRIELIQMLATLATRASQSQQLREIAYLWANRLGASERRGTDAFNAMLARLEADPAASHSYFAVSLAEQVKEEAVVAPIERWLEERFSTPLSEIVHREHIREASDRVSTANAVGSLRVLAHISYPSIFEAVSAVEAELRKDPSGIYSRSDFATRDQSRHQVERIARRSGLSEIEVARTAVALATQGEDSERRHVAYYLISDGVTRLEAETGARPRFQTEMRRAVRRYSVPLYLGSNLILTACFTGLAIALAHDFGARSTTHLIVLAALALLPLSELAAQIVHALVISLLPPGRLPKMDFRERIPPDCATLIVVPMMLSNLEVIREEVEKLEVRFLANQDDNLFFALFSDFTDAEDAVTPADAALLEAAQSGIRVLNTRYPGGRFLLFHRRREWSPSEQRWIGRERKRGKLEDLNSFLGGYSQADILSVGELPRPIPYVITLDADTQLPPGTARRMVETIAHPLNRVVIDPVTRTRQRGYSIIQPRISIALPQATATFFTRVFSDTSGTDPYCEIVSDAQMDLLGEGIFHGKAIYDVKAFCTTLQDRFPPETLLSHDLIEGAHAGAGLATDIELFENVPHTYVGYARRQHRWIRGDWQIGQWILPRVPAADGEREPNPLNALNRWRILDNLRRSLVPIASMLMLLFGWLISAAPGVWSVVVGLAVAIPAIAPLLDRFARRVTGTVHAWRGAADELVRAVVMLAFLPHQAWISADAIARVSYRTWFSKRKRLEWETAEATGARVRAHSNRTFRQLAIVSILSVLLLFALHARSAFVPTFLFVALWIVSPALMFWLDRPLGALGRFRRPGEDTAFLRRRARRTWRYFDDLVNDESHWLPPDNKQFALKLEVAQRTSPTNIGLWIGSALAAHDFGYLDADQLWRRLARTLETLDTLERFEGHPLNWYDTRTLQPLTPRYVSTVDSGNLLATLWLLEEGCHDVARAPVLGPECFRGLTDTLGILRETCERDVSISVPIRQLRNLLHAGPGTHELIGRLRLASSSARQIMDAKRWPAPEGDECSYWASRLMGEVTAWIETVDRYLPWMETLTRPPDAFLGVLGEEAVELRHRALDRIPGLAALASDGVPAVDAILAYRGTLELRPELAQWLDQLALAYNQARTNAAQMVKSLAQLEADANRLSRAINMRFLFDASRKLFAIGYAVGGPLEFTTHYDLLASECRLASLVAIAKGDAPIEHWAALARPRGRSAHGPTLLSWSGTMFEYLMPLLLMRAYSGSLLDGACRDAVRFQMKQGVSEGVPWGVSECAYSALDGTQTYQYRAFGTPALALKRGLDEDLVITSYATMLALTIAPKAAIENLKRLEREGLSGPMGFYESIDYTREKREGDRGVVVFTYMAHHQGMSLIALDNALHHDVMQRRFHRDPRIRAFETLLFERVPLIRVKGGEPEPTPSPLRLAAAEEPDERIWKENTSIPRVHINGNGNYTVMLTNSGAGFSRWKDFDITRWRADPALDPWGSFIYVRDVRMQRTWSVALQPAGGSLGASTAAFSVDRAQFRRSVLEIETTLDVAVAPEDDVELRRVQITNRSRRARQLEFTSYAELVLAPHADDVAHPAFAKMFVETEYAGDCVLIARRRKKAAEDPEVWAAHMLVGAVSGVEYETDRARFLGRGNTPESAEALTTALSGSQGPVLDPVFSLRCRVTLDPRQNAELVFITLAAGSRDALLALIQKYKRPDSTARALEMAWTRAQLALRYLGIRSVAARRFQELAGSLLYPNPQLRPPPGRLAKNRLGQSALWAYGISGTLPMLAITVADERGLGLVREILTAHGYWRALGFRADIVIVDQESASYDQPLHVQIARHIEAHAHGADPGGVFLLDSNTMPPEHVELILAASGVVLYGSRGSLQQQLASVRENAAPPDLVPVRGAVEEVSRQLPFLELPYFNGLGGFTGDGREYAIYLAPGKNTPMSWSNVMANPRFGTMTTESGLGYTWNGNSQSNRLTPWSNDPIGDPQSETIYLRDEDSGAVWTPTALPIREDDAYRARHGQGYTVFEHNSHAVGQELTVFIPVDAHGTGDPVKILRLRLRNDSSHRRRLSATCFIEWVLGSTREEQQWRIHSSCDGESGAVLAFQSWKGDVSKIAFAAASPRATSYSDDRVQFLGRNGSTARPAAMGRVSLDNRCGSGADPAAALQVAVTLERGASTEVIFLLGEAASIEEARTLISRYSRAEAVETSLSETRNWWDSILGALQVRTPLRSADLLLNRWLLYQVMSCRFWARTALYQSSGAFGFRDQLQDSMAFLYSAPQLARAHILAAAARQFLEGDVQHWWHSETGLGVRTRCSDDLVWLPYVVAQYVTVTGDLGVLDESVPFLEGLPLKDDEPQRMFIPVISDQHMPLWEHCRRALEHAWRLGEHGLPLMGGGDWNDGLDRVGAAGRGESVWLAWFLSSTLRAFAGIIEDHPERAGIASLYRDRAALLPEAVERSAWDGEWYLRAFFDNGAPLGSHANAESRIDSLSQSWAAISGAGDPARVSTALESADHLLVDEHNRLVKLLTPPFDHSTPHPGYIMGYPPGVRENGGQYTHGSLWLAMAHARMGDGDAAVRLLQIMNPVESNRDEAGVRRFGGEPYVAPADVSSAPGREGRCGWTWYTGSAAWMYRIWIEEVLGFRLRGNTLTIQPAMPRDWPGFEVTYRYRSSTYKIRVERDANGAVMDGPGGRVIKLVDDGATHEEVVRVGERKAEPEIVESKPLESANGIPKPSGELMPR